MYYFLGGGTVGGLATQSVDQQQLCLVAEAEGKVNNNLRPSQKFRKASPSPDLLHEDLQFTSSSHTEVLV